MEKLILLAVCGLSSAIAFGQCSTSYSFSASSETVNFSNLSSVSNGHYFWNFGDGTGSTNINPSHKFPETGEYLVTLFANDTVSNCSSFYEKRINVIKFSTDICQPDSITDSISHTPMAFYLNLIDNSQGCNNYSKWCEAGVNSTMPSPASISINNYPARYVARIQYSNNQSVNLRSLYKTIPFRYTSAKNYNNCSANFEFRVVSQNAGGQRIVFRAMNKTATSYHWLVESSSNFATSNNDTISHFYPFDNKLYSVHLRTTGSIGCKDSLVQTILIVDTAHVITEVKAFNLNKLSLNIYPNPAQDKIIISNAIEVEKITLMSPLGLVLFVANMPKLNQEIIISHLPAGVYFLKADSKRSQVFFKVVKE
jgi:PKD repeat protein